MFEFDKLCDAYEQLSFAELTAVVRDESALIMPALLSMDAAGGTDAFLLLVATACGASGKLEFAEYKMFEEATGVTMTYEEACVLIEKAKRREAQDIVDELADAFGELDEEIKASMLSFCLAFCAANGYIDLRERLFLKRLLR